MVDRALGIAIPLVLGYLIGGIPFALIAGRAFYGIDLREHGSGNLGATNVLRVLGVRAALAVAALDVGKGAAAVAIAMLAAPRALSGSGRDWVLVWVSVAAIAGHTFSPYIRFRGGKGVATAAGAIAVMMPIVWPVLFATFVAVIALTRIVSLASLVVAVEFVVLAWVVYHDRAPLVVFAVVAAALVVFQHRSNIARLVRGEERKISVGRAAPLPREKER